jgi:hypothetical protein
VFIVSRMESQQIGLVDDDIFDVQIHNVLKAACVICKKLTTFRYGSIPLCETCARERGF